MLVKVWCEWDIGLNVTGNTGVYSSYEAAVRVLENVHWCDIDYNNWEEACSDDMLEITEINGD